MNDLSADFIRRFGQEARTVDIDRLSPCRILFRLVDLEHRAIDDQRRLGMRRRNAAQQRDP